jgi:hypothetical protein
MTKYELSYFRNKTINELEAIQPKWAYGNNQSKALSYFKDQLREGYRVFLVKPIELIKNANLFEVNTDILFTGNTLSDERLAGILSRWTNHEFVDPPTIYYLHSDSFKLAFSDGRHRAKLAFILAHYQLPVAIHKSDIRKISAFMDITTI